MEIVLVTGGARSGKSRYAQQRAHEAGGDAVTVIATAQASDPEMALRIARHRAERPAAWVTLERPLQAGAALREAGTAVVLLDCLTVLAGNTLGRARPMTAEAALAAIDTEVAQLLHAAASRAGTLIVVTNEVGSAIHPPTALGRWFQDGLGAANARIGAQSREAVLLVAGMPLVLKRG